MRRFFSRNKIRTIRWTRRADTRFFALLVASHCWSHGWIEGERMVAAGLEMLTADAAASVGYVKAPPPPRKLSQDELIEREALRNGYSPALLRSLRTVESRGKVRAESPKGARGVLQVMPWRAKECGLTEDELYDQEKNIACGAYLLKLELVRLKWDVIKALRAYNGGPKCQEGGCRESDAHSRDVVSLTARDIRT